MSDAKPIPAEVLRSVRDFSGPPWPKVYRFCYGPHDVSIGMDDLAAYALEMQEALRAFVSHQNECVKCGDCGAMDANEDRARALLPEHQGEWVGGD